MFRRFFTPLLCAALMFSWVVPAYALNATLSEAKTEMKAVTQAQSFVDTPKDIAVVDIGGLVGQLKGLFPKDPFNIDFFCSLAGKIQNLFAIAQQLIGIVMGLLPALGFQTKVVDSINNLLDSAQTTVLDKIHQVTGDMCKNLQQINKVLGDSSVNPAGLLNLGRSLSKMMGEKSVKTSGGCWESGTCGTMPASGHYDINNAGALQWMQQFLSGLFSFINGMCGGCMGQGFNPMEAVQSAITSLVCGSTGDSKNTCQQILDKLGVKGNLASIGSSGLTGGSSGGSVDPEAIAKEVIAPMVFLTDPNIDSSEGISLISQARNFWAANCAVKQAAVAFTAATNASLTLQQLWAGVNSDDCKKAGVSGDACVSCAQMMAEAKNLRADVQAQTCFAIGMMVLQYKQLELMAITSFCSAMQAFPGMPVAYGVGANPRAD